MRRLLRTDRRSFLRNAGGIGIASLLGTTTAAATDTEERGTKPTSHEVPPLKPYKTEQLSDRLVEITFENPLVDPPLSQATVRVLLPTDYHTSDKTYPTVYLFHGRTGAGEEWTTLASGSQAEDDDSPSEGEVGPLQNYTEDAEMVFVTPDAGYAGWYSDWFNDGSFGSPQWETFHIRQLIPFIEDNFRVRQERGGRVVAGLSMGGFGALKYGARYPDLFAGVYSFSGAPLSIEQAKSDAESGELDIYQLRAWGDPREHETRWAGNMPTRLVENYENVRLYLAVGEGEPGGPAPTDDNEDLLGVERAVYQLNEELVDQLDEAGIEYTYETFEQRAHNWWWWHNDLKRVLPDIAETFEEDSSAPSEFSYQSIQPEFDIWGWNITRQDLDYETAEFVYLEDVSSDGLTVRGRGSVNVESPGIYDPRETYEVAIEDGEEGEVRIGPDSGPERITADDEGRLEFTIRLGPPAEYPEYLDEELQSATVSIGRP